MIEHLLCSRCNYQLKDNDNFCARCGLARCHQQSFKINFKIWIGVSLLSALFITAIYKTIAGTKPQKHFTEFSATSTSEEGVVDDLEYKKLIELAVKEKDNLIAWRNAAEYLIAKINKNNQTTDQSVLVELIEILREILRLDPNDPDSLLAMAEISFETQIFSKAKEYYQKYLAIEPNNSDIKARYAASLGFLGEFERAISTLRELCEQAPNNFNARAFLVVALAQKGDREQALAEAQKALELAPNDETRLKFSEFVEKIRNKKEVGGTLSESKETKSSEESSKGIKSYQAWIESQPIAGNKFRGLKEEREKLYLLFENFPIELMPAEVKKKFLNNLKEQAVKAELKFEQYIIIDNNSGEKLAEF
ncbi:MAG TPA: hypothetical protein PKD37_02635 [Oligoflexia bacterium]|nr:hypothetical protein [Oligoflexia bacterium]HMP26867.1 hypothetical protein [Oligoflexia bacterium]